jgi:hypothetical protein
VPDPDQGLVGGTVGELEAGQVAMCRSKMPHSVIHRAFSLKTDARVLRDPRVINLIVKTSDNHGKESSLNI